MDQDYLEKRSEPRIIVDQYYSVEIWIKAAYLKYQFKIRDLSPHGMCILVKEESELLKLIKVGDVMEMTYYLETSPTVSERLATRIAHITPAAEGRFKNHFFVGLFIERGT